MSAPAHATTTPGIAVDRVNFAFSLDGLHAACVRIDERHCTLEAWSFSSGSAHNRVVPGPTVTPATSVLPLGDGRILLHPNRTERDELTLVDLRHDQVAVHTLGAVRGLGSYLLPSPHPAALGYLISREDNDHSVIWHISHDSSAVTPVLRLPGAATGGTWLDDQAGLLALNLAEHGRGTHGILADLRNGRWTPFFSISKDSNDRVIAYNPRSRLLVLATTASGHERLGWTRLGNGHAVRFPELLHRDGHRRQVLALDEAGDALLLHEQCGTRSALLTYTVSEDRIRQRATPEGTLRPPASWSADAIRLPFSTPRHPPTVLSLPSRDDCGFGPALNPSPPGRQEGRDFHHHEIEGGHTEIVGGPPAPLRELIVAFSRSGGQP